MSQKSTTPENPGHSKIMQWIAAHLDYPHDWCLIWPFARGKDGYGHFGRNGKFVAAHRYICDLVKGPPPTPRHHAAHSCGRGHHGCCNPRHIDWKTNSANQHDRTDQWRRKMTPEKVAEIRSVAGLEPVEVTAARFDIREVTVRHIQAGKMWREDRIRLRRIFGDDEVRAIRALKGTRPQREVAEQYGATIQAIYLIQSGKSYKHVPWGAPQDGGRS